MSTDDSRPTDLEKAADHTGLVPPTRREFLQRVAGGIIVFVAFGDLAAAQEAANEPVVKQTFPWLDDKAAPEFAKAQAVQALMPELRSRTPAHRVATGTYVVGLTVMDALHAAGYTGDALKAVKEVLAKAYPAKGTATATAKTPPPKAPTAGAAPQKVTPQKSDAARQKFSQAPTRQNAVDMARAALAGV